VSVEIREARVDFSSSDMARISAAVTARFQPYCRF
jgi:hypothetical protein